LGETEWSPADEKAANDNQSELQGFDFGLTDLTLTRVAVENQPIFYTDPSCHVFLRLKRMSKRKSFSLSANSTFFGKTTTRFISTHISVDLITDKSRNEGETLYF
jgi:hypothetical protein